MLLLQQAANIHPAGKHPSSLTGKPFFKICLNAAVLLVFCLQSSSVHPVTVKMCRGAGQVTRGNTPLKMKPRFVVQVSLLISAPSFLPNFSLLAVSCEETVPPQAPRTHGAVVVFSLIALRVKLCRAAWLTFRLPTAHLRSTD